MLNDKSQNKSILSGLTLTVILGISFLAAYPVMGHGGKDHGGTNFSSLQAVQKATELYDRLITMGKLPEEWETRLISIEVGTRQHSDKNEYVIQFKRAEGDPESVFFFFDQTGNYSGSNFTGQ
jgi:hypothetical protein